MNSWPVFVGGPTRTGPEYPQRQDSVSTLIFSNFLPIRPPSINMEMKKIACAALVAAASVCVAMAHEAEGPAPGPASDAIVALPALGSLVSASLASFFALYMH
ncbi:hypothetical protein LguiA_019451 [Lonicera macranthoides]